MSSGGLPPNAPRRQAPSRYSDPRGNRERSSPLWLFSRMNSGEELPEHSHRFMEYALRKGCYNDFSFDGVYNNLEAEMRPIMEAPFSEEQLARARP